MQNKKSISLAKKGMNQDTHFSQLKAEEYRIAVNANTSTEDGNGLNIMNEPSNYFGVLFPENYKVVGFKRLEEKTYFFLTSTETDSENEHYRRSSIGYVLNNVFDTYNQDGEDVNCDGCNPKNTLDTPLEDVEQTPSHQYVELVHDRCISLPDIEEMGLNFNINFPIKKVEVKQEKLGTNLYWNDYRNPFRYLQVTRIEEALENNTFDYLHTLEVPCEDPSEASCLDADKLLVFPKYKRMKIEAKEEQIGGNLKKGTYEFWGAYCDAYGNEITEYCTPTNPISIWDEYNNILEQTELDEFTNYAIKLKIHNLDVENFKYYKIAVVERNNVQNTQSVFLAGIFPTTDDIVVYTHSGSNNDDLYITRGNISVKKRMDFNTLTAIKPSYKRAKGTMVSDDRLWAFGLEEEQEINLQPVVNLFSSLLHWQTSAASENLYKSFIANSKFKGFMRNEVQPFSIRFLYDNGGYSATFPFIGRPMLDGEDDVVDDLNSQSVNFQGNSCATVERDKKWQIFNTATAYEEVCVDYTEGGIEVTDTVEKTCYIEEVATIPADTIKLQLNEQFYDLESYINDHREEICDVDSDYYNETFCEYLSDEYEDTCSPSFVGTCSAPELESEENIVGDVVGESVTYTEDDEKELGDYQKSVSPNFCFPFKRDQDSGGYVEDSSFMSSFMPCSGSNRLKVFVRDSQFYNEDCVYATDVPIQYNPTQSTNSVFLNYAGDIVKENLLQNDFDVTETSLEFNNKLHAKAQFFKIDKAGKDKIIFEITKKSSCEVANNGFNSTNIRYTFYTECNNPVELGGSIVDLNVGEFMEVDISTFPNTFIVAVDSPMTEDIINITCGNNSPYDTLTEVIDNTVTNPPLLSGVYLVPSGASGVWSTHVGDIATSDDDGETWTFNTPTPQDAVLVTSGANIGLIYVFDIIDGWELFYKKVYRIEPPCSCFSIYTRDIEYDTVTVGWEEINITKKQTYSSTCTYNLPNVNGCDVIPYKKGVMAYWESTNEYPDNKQLYDSSILNIKPSDIANLSEKDSEEFVQYYTDGLDEDGNYILKGADFRCQKIRHPKMPDNTVAPFIIDNLALQKNADSIIFPLGVNLDGEVVKAMLNVAYANGLLTKKQRESIVGWELLRGDNSIHKSVISNGLIYDMYKYQKGGDTVHFANFPFNDLGDNKFALNDDGQLIKHPNGGDSNHLFSFISPDIFLTSPTLPSEMSLQGFMFGGAESGVALVDEHPKWTVLGRDSYTTAEILAAAEVVLEATLKYTEMQIQANQGYWFIAGFANGTGAAGGGISSVMSAVMLGTLLAQGFIKFGEYRYNWLQIFRNLGRTDNFATFQFSNAKYNKLLRVENEDESYLRKLFVRKYLKDGDYNIIDESNGSHIKVNNWKREYSALLSTGEDFQIDYTNYPDYTNFDNNKVSSTSSNFLPSELNCDINTRFSRDVASPYVSLKNYIPDQWDTVDSIKWLTTNYIFDLDDDTSCTPIYGGTVCISRFNWRRKVPLFTDNAIGLADKLPYLYSRSSNIGKTRFYCNYETSEDTIFQYLGVPFPDIRSEYNFDCQTGRNSFYLRPPSKFYLFVHSIADFLVESEINCNFRYGKPQPKDQFYNGQQLSSWLQETNLPIVEPNTFYYNNTYTFPVSNSQYKKLDRTYDKEVWAKRAIKDNAWIWSEKDVNENALVDPWLVFRPLNFFEDKTDRGKLIDLRSIESNQFFGRFENQLQLYNEANTVADAINNQNRELGTGFFTTRPINFKKADLGFAGTQNTDFVSTPYGHFWVDAKRGRIFQVDQNGGNMEVISETIGGQPSNMKQWFREHLPFKILKHLPNIDIDNKFKGIGMNIWYDDRNSRVFFTKRDYIVKQGVDKSKFSFDKDTQQLLFNGTEVFFNNETLFKDVSWTITYKPTEGTWNSYFTFYPDYSISHQEFFQVGYNWGAHKETLWNHTLNNRSFGVFQGEFHPFVVEFPVANENVNKILNSLAFNIESKRYINQWDNVVHKDIGMTDMFIYNATNNTGYLVLHPQKTLADERKYPYVENNKQHILTTFEEGKQNVNYFFNRVLNQDNNIPHLIKDENNIFKEVNTRAVKFGGKRLLERLKGDVFIVNLSNTKDSRFNILIKNIINNETIYE